MFFEAGGGCANCNRSGFVGRTGIYEYRDLRGPVAEQLIERRNQFDPLAAEGVFALSVEAGDVGARSMREDGLLKAAVGMTTPEEVMGATMDGPKLG